MSKVNDMRNIDGSSIDEELVVAQVAWVVDPLLSKIMLIRVVDVEGLGVVAVEYVEYP